MIHIYCGDGKGKSTAAFGLAVRAVGSGYRVVMAQFLKGRASGEMAVFSQLEGVTLLQAELQDTFSWRMTETERTRATADHNHLLARAAALCGPGPTLLVLDELIGAYGEKLLDREAVLCLLREQREKIEIVLTGRNPAPELLELADYVTEMKKIKHPYDKGVQLRKGIEY